MDSVSEAVEGFSFKNHGRSSTKINTKDDQFRNQKKPFLKKISVHVIKLLLLQLNFDMFLQAENVMLLELDMSPPTMFTLNLNGTHLERAFSPRLMRDLLGNAPVRERTGASSRVRKSQSW